MLFGTGQDAKYWFDRGFDMIIVGAIITHFIQGLERNLADARPKTA